MVKRLFFIFFTGFFLYACQELPPEAYLIDKYKITGQIDVKPDIKDQCKDGVLFLIVRKGASPQPLAVKKFRDLDFPKSFTVSPADVLMPQRVNEFDGQLIIMARVSKSGSPFPQKGDCESDAKVVEAGSRGIKITINRVVK